GALPAAGRRGVGIAAAFDGVLDIAQARALGVDDEVMAGAIAAGFLVAAGAALRLARVGEASGLLAGLEPSERRAIHAAAAAHLDGCPDDPDRAATSARAADR